MRWASFRLSQALAVPPEVSPIWNSVAVTEMGWDLALYRDTRPMVEKVIQEEGHAEKESDAAWLCVRGECNRLRHARVRGEQIWCGQGLGHAEFDEYLGH
jgi:hypothetical protein